MTSMKAIRFFPIALLTLFSCSPASTSLEESTEEKTTIPYSYYLPDNITRNTGFLLMLHGGHSSGELFAYSTGIQAYANEHNFAILFPSASKYNEQYWPWWVKDAQEGTYPDIVELKDLCVSFMREQHLNPYRSYVAGFSAGACYAVNLYVSFPDTFRGVASVGGLPYHVVSNTDDALALMAEGATKIKSPELMIHGRMQGDNPIKALIFSGKEDKVVNPRNSEILTEQFVYHLDRLDDQEGNHSYKEKIEDFNKETPYHYTKSVYENEMGYVASYSLDNLGHSWSVNDNQVNYSKVIVETFF